jgi:hypothetical protein
LKAEAQPGRRWNDPAGILTGAAEAASLPARFKSSDHCVVTALAMARYRRTRD